jgi:hypothetical protein
MTDAAGILEAWKTRTGAHTMITSDTGPVREYACPRCPRRAYLKLDGEWPFSHVYPLADGAPVAHWIGTHQVFPQAKPSPDFQR